MVLCHRTLASLFIKKHKSTAGKYAKSRVNDDGLVVNVFSPAEVNEGQRGVGFIPLAFALQGEPLIVK